jgi:hypothetical protein
MSNFIVSMDDGSERSVQAFNYIDSDGDLLLARSPKAYIENLFTAVMLVRQMYSVPRMVILKIDDNFSAIILPINGEDNSILFMEVPGDTTKYVNVDKHGKLTSLLGYDIPVVFTHLTELEYTFF